MSKYITGKTYKKYLNNDAIIDYKILGRTAKSVTVVIHPGSKYEKVKRLKVYVAGAFEQIKLAETIYGESDDEIREEA